MPDTPGDPDELCDETGCTNRAVWCDIDFDVWCDEHHHSLTARITDEYRTWRVKRWADVHRALDIPLPTTKSERT